MCNIKLTRDSCLVNKYTHDVMWWWLLYAPGCMVVVTLLLWITLRISVTNVKKNLEDKLKLKIKIGSIKLRSVVGISVEKEGLFTLQIEHIKFCSKLFNDKECTKFFCISIGATAFDILKCSQEEKLDATNKSISKQNDGNDDRTAEKVLNSTLLVFMLQHIEVNLENALVTFGLLDTTFVWSTESHITIYKELQNLCLKIDLSNCKFTALHKEFPLLYINHELSVNVSVPPTAKVQSMTSSILIKNLQVNINEDFVDHINSIKKKQLLKKDSSSNLRETQEEKEIFQEEFNNNVLKRMKPIPQMIKLSMENSKFIYRLKNGRQLQTDWNCVLTWQRFHNDHTELSLDVLGFVINADTQTKLLLLKQLTSKINLCPAEPQYKLITHTKFDTCHVDFVYEQFNFWKSHVVSKLENYDETQSVPVRQETSNKPSVPHSRPPQGMTRLVQHFQLSFDLQLENCSCDFHWSIVQTELSTAYVGNFKLEITQAVPNEKVCYCLEVVDIYVYINTEEVLKHDNPLKNDENSLDYAGPCQLQDDNPACMPTSERHVWGRIFELAKVKINCTKEGTVMSTRCDCVFFAVEVSYAMLQALHTLINNTQLLSKREENKRKQVDDVGKGNSSLKVNTEVCVKSVNIFLMGDKEGGYNSLLVKSNEVNASLQNNATSVNVSIDGVVVAQLTEITLLKTGDPFKCVSANEYRSKLLFSPGITLAVLNKDISANVEKVDVTWSPNKQMCLFEQLTSLQKLPFEELIKKKSVEKSPSLSTPNVKVVVKQVYLLMETQKLHSFGVGLKEMRLSSADKSCALLEASVLFDEQEIFNLKNLSLKQLAPGKSKTSSREQFKKLQPNNRAWDVVLDDFYLTFPYNFDFAASLSQLQLVIKLIKQQVKKPRPPGVEEGLYSDLHISCNNFSWEIEDDPFEVKLGDNYTLLLDEMEQSSEREVKLEERIEIIKTEKGTSISSKKLEELRESLRQLSAKLYIDRSKNMYEDRPARVSLFLLGIKDIQLSVHSDESLNGSKNIRQQMQLLDESTVPEDFNFSTLWARMVNGKFHLLRLQVRDYPQPIVYMEQFSTRGIVIGSEVSSVGTQQQYLSSYEVPLNICYPWKDCLVRKNMPPQKFHYDLKWDMSTCQLGYGGNFEPAFAMINSAFEKLSKPSMDKSPPLPFWDKMRLLFHGRLKADIADLNIALSASTDPYNTTEKLELEWSAVTLEWTDGNISVDGDLDMFTRNASKYDDSKVLHFPSFKLVIGLEWLCRGDSKNHHYALPLNPDQSQVSDSYSNFRSSNLNMEISMNMTSDKENCCDTPAVFLYASTFRWFQNFQAVAVSRVSRPIKRGSLFNTLKKRKTTFGRHCKLVGIELEFPSLNVTYWGSFQQDRGFEIQIQAGSLAVAYQVYISAHPDTRLLRRAVAQWIIRGLTCRLERVRAYLLQSVENQLKVSEDEDDLLCIDIEEELLKKHYLFSVSKVDYVRQSSLNEDLFNHKIVLQNLKGAWTAVNRELVVGLFEAYSKMQLLKNVLSSDALKATSEKTSHDRTESSGVLKKEKTPSSTTTTTRSPMTRMQSGDGLSLLRKLVNEQSSKFIAQVEEGESEINETELAEIESDDIIKKNWHIELVDSQVLLHGTESKGAVIVTSGNATILKRLHIPVVTLQNKLNKTTWCGMFRNMQYFTTVENFKDLTVENIPWVTDDVISGTTGADISLEDNISMFAQSSDAVGSFVEIPFKGVVHQLQRVISRCKCEFTYVSLSDELDPLAEEYKPIVKTKEELSSSSQLPLSSSLTLKHGKLEMSTSSTQYSVISDVVQNLVLYQEPKKKEEAEELEKMKFKLQLAAEQDLKLHVAQLQSRVRHTQMMLRQSERRWYDLKRSEQNHDDCNEVDEIEEELEDLQQQIQVTKDQLYDDVEELKILINAYGDIALAPSPQKGSGSLVNKKIDVCFDDLLWHITQQDGQLGIANVNIQKFNYNMITYLNNASENLFEVGHFSVKNLLPGDIYREAFVPHEVNIRRCVDKTIMLRVFCKVSPAVAGIQMREHFEVNVCPIAVRLTHKLFVHFEAFFFPTKAHASADDNTSQQSSEVQLGVRLAPEPTATIIKEEATPVEKPPRPAPPPRPPPPQGHQCTHRRSASEGVKKSLSLASVASNPSLEDENTITPPITPRGTSMKRASFRGIPASTVKHAVSSADRDINTMKERAAKNQTFIYVKIPEVPICFSYKGEKERNIEDARDFNLCLPTLEYQSRTWTWQDLFQAMKKDYIRILVPQILKEKLHLKSSGAETLPTIAQTDDTNKTKLLFGEKSGSSQPKKSAKKMLFGKLRKHGKHQSSSASSSQEKLNEPNVSEDPKQHLMGKGVAPNNLEEAFNKLRDLGNQ